MTLKRPHSLIEKRVRNKKTLSQGFVNSTVSTYNMVRDPIEIKNKKPLL